MHNIRTFDVIHRLNKAHGPHRARDVHRALTS